MSLLGLALANLVIMYMWKPFEDRSEYLSQLFSEGTIIINQYLFTSLLRTDQDYGFRKVMSYMMIGFSMFNVALTILYMVISSIVGFAKGCWFRGQQFKNKRKETDRLKNRQKLLKTRYMNHYKLPNFIAEEKFLETLRLLEEWRPHREWLIKNGHDVNDFEEERVLQLRKPEYELQIYE